MANSITVTLTFTEKELNALLVEANMGMGKPLTVKRIIKAGNWDCFVKEFNPKQMKDEYIETSEESMSNGWLSEFAGTNEEDDE